MTHAQRLATVKRREIDRHSLGREVRHEPEYLRNRVLPNDVSRSREVRPFAEYRVDRANAGVARPDLEEDAHAISIRRLNDLWNVDRVEQPRGDRVRAVPLGRRVALPPRAAVDRHTFRWRDRERVQLAIGFFNRLPDLAVRECHTG